MTYFTIDGATWEVPCDVTREVEIRDSSISGYMMDGSYFHDVIGTYLSYTVRIVCNPEAAYRYHELFERITEPVDGHAFVLPYNDGTVEITGRVSDVGDVWRVFPGGDKIWVGLEFTITANHPTRYNDLEQVLQVGRAPIPDASTPTAGDTYVYDPAAGWEYAEYGDGDNRKY